MKDTPIYMGVDCGRKGGISVIVDDELFVYRIPADNCDLLSIFRLNAQARVMVEQLVPYAKNTRTCFVMGREMERVLVCLDLLHMDYELIQASTWMQYTGLKKEKGESASAWKQRLATLARSMWPNKKIVKDLADSVLIAAYCKAYHEGFEDAGADKEGRGVRDY